MSLSRQAKAWFGLLVALVVVSVGVFISSTMQEQLRPVARLRLYFPDRQATGLVPQEYRVTPDELTPQHAVELLLSSPERPSLASAFPPGTRLRAFSLEGHVAIVDLSAEAKGATGSAGEQLAIYALVNTLTEWPDIKAVRVYVEGEPIDTLSGHVDLSRPLPRDTSYILPQGGGWFRRGNR